MALIMLSSVWITGGCGDEKKPRGQTCEQLSCGANSVCDDAGDPVACVCQSGFADCNEDPTDGCEAAETNCICSPGAEEPCYSGPVGTDSNLPCQAGSSTCGATGTAWGGCQNEIVPASEICGNGVDEDCSGVADDGC